MPTTPPDNPLADRHVLIVEDEFMIAFTLQVAIEDAGGEATIAATVKRALADVATMALDELPDIAILDVQVGTDAVYPVADALTEGGVPFVFHSGHADTDVLLGRYPGAASLPKPAPLSAMTDRLAEMLAA